MNAITNKVRNLAKKIAKKYKISVSIGHNYWYYNSENISGFDSEKFKIYFEDEQGKTGKHMFEYIGTVDELILLMQDILENGYEKYLK